MRRFKRAYQIGLVAFSISIIVILFIAALPGQSTAVLRIAAPAYAYPCTGSPCLWTQLENSAPGVQFIIMNPENGVGTAQDSNYTPLLQTAQARQIAIAGYIDTHYAAIPIATVEAAIDHYFAWYNVNGIFLDEASPDATDQPYYQTLYKYIKMGHSTATVIINPGTNTDESYINAADIILSFESSYATYVPFTPDGWQATYPASRFWHIVYGVDATQLPTAIQIARARNAGWVYIMPDTLEPGYATPINDSYWSQELTLVAGGITPSIDTIGIYRSGTFYLRLHNTTGTADLSAAFTAGTKPYPIVGDWVGAGFDSIGVYDQNTGFFYLRNSNTAGSADETLLLGNPQDTPLSGRWQINATHAGVGVFRPTNGILYMKNALTSGYSDYSDVLGNPGDAGIAGDWTGKGFHSPGVYRPSATEFFLSNLVTNGIVYGDINFIYGSSTDLPIAGDWIAQGQDGVGLFRPTTGDVFLKNALTSGIADNSFTYGQSGDVPIAGHWQLNYPPIAPPPMMVLNHNGGSGSVPGGNQIGG